MVLVGFSIGNIIGTEIFQAKDAPNYIPGKVAVMVLLTIQLLLCFVFKWVHIRRKAEKRRLVEEEKRRKNWTDEDVERERQRHAFLDLTDKQ